MSNKIGKLVLPDYKIIYEQSPVSTQILTPDGKTVSVNKAWEELWNVSFDQIKDYNVLDDPQLQEKGIIPYIKQGFAGKNVSIPPFKYEPKKTLDLKTAPEFLWVQARIYPIRDQNEKIQYIVLQHEDITAQIVLEQDNMEQEERLRLAIEAGKIGVWDWDIVHNTLTWSPRVYELHGVSPGTIDLNFDNFLGLIHPEDQNRIRKSIHDSLHADKPFEVELRVVTPDKQIRWLTTSGLITRNEKSEPIRMLGATADITTRKRLESQKDEFIAIASHELKTPLTSIKAFNQVLQNRLQKKQVAGSVELLQKMNTQINKLNLLIQDLLDVTKIESGQLKFKHEQYNFDELVMETIDEIQRTTSHKLIKKGLTQQNIIGDRDRIGQVLTNLLTNAIKYSGNSNKIIIKLSSTNKKLKCAVQDFGIGIPLDKQAHIFERFYRVDEEAHHTIPGIGLGLYISSEIIKRQGGEIGFTSEKGVGSTFYFTLPLSV